MGFAVVSEAVGDDFRSTPSSCELFHSARHRRWQRPVVHSPCGPPSLLQCWCRTKLHRTSGSWCRRTMLRLLGNDWVQCGSDSALRGRSITSPGGSAASTIGWVNPFADSGAVRSAWLVRWPRFCVSWSITCHLGILTSTSLRLNWCCFRLTPTA